MKAVTGSVLSSEPVSLKRAAGIISNFAVSDSIAQPEVAAYVRRASRGFNELLQLHREIRASRRGSGPEAPVEEQQQREDKEERHNKKKRREMAVDGPDAGSGGIPVATRKEEARRNLADKTENGVILGIHEERDGKKRKKTKEKVGQEEERGALVWKNTDSVGVKEEKSGERKKKKDMKMNHQVELGEEPTRVNEERSAERKKEKDKKRNQETELESHEHNKVELREEERSEERKKKKDKKRNRVGELNVEEKSDVGGKKRKHLDSEVEGRGLDDRIGDLDSRNEHKKKKRRRED